MSDASAGSAPHHEVASYALGLLDDAESSAFEGHLVACDACARELESFLPVVDLLTHAGQSAADVPSRPADVPDELAARRGRRSGGRPGPAVTGRAGRLVASARAGLRRPAVAAAVAAVAAAGITAAGVGTFEQNEIAAPALATGTDTSAPWNALQGPDLGTGREFETTDDRSGVHGQVVLEDAPWGTRVSFALWQLVGPQECRLVVVRRGGGGQTVSTWTVPSSGYGRAGQPQPLVLQAATSIPLSQVQAVVVESVGPAGSRPLLRVAP